MILSPHFLQLVKDYALKSGLPFTTGKDLEKAVRLYVERIAKMN